MRQRILSKPRTSVTAIIAVMAAVLYLCLAALPVRAAEGFDFYTDNPGIHVTAGDSVSFSLHLAGSNAAGSDVSLSVVSMPEGFTGFFKSGSYEVSKVHAGGDGARAWNLHFFWAASCVPPFPCLCFWAPFCMPLFCLQASLCSCPQFSRILRRRSNWKGSSNTRFFLSNSSMP